MMARRDNADPTGIGHTSNWACAWPANRRVLYNRASCDLARQALGSQRKLIAWNGTAWGGADVPDYRPTRTRTTACGPFIMNPEGVARLFARGAMVEGPFPEHYEPFERRCRPTRCIRTSRRREQPGRARVRTTARRSASRTSSRTSATTYRLTEHFHFWTKHVAQRDRCSRSSSSRSARQLADGDRHRQRRRVRVSLATAATSRPWRWSPSASSR
jgi:formate dehydrogenase major subunit